MIYDNNEYMVNLQKLDSSDDWHESFVVELSKLNKIRLNKLLNLLKLERSCNRDWSYDENNLYDDLLRGGFFSSNRNLGLFVESFKKLNLLYLLDKDSPKDRIAELEKTIELKDGLIDYYKEGLKDAQEQIEKLKVK